MSIKKENRTNYVDKNHSLGLTPKLRKFIREHSYFWWWVPEEKKESLSLASVVEATLNYGNTKDIKLLFNIIGYQKTKEIFLNQVSGKRPNYSKRTANYFKLYFEKHA